MTTEWLAHPNLSSSRPPIYAVAGDDGGTVHVLIDANGDGVAETKDTFQVRDEESHGLKILDAALIDISGRSHGDQALVTLHEVDGRELLVISRDSDDDGIIDDGDPVYVTDEAVADPRGLAVDGRTGRVFVSGLIDGVPSVVFYQDADGDKVVDPGTAYVYFDDGDAGGDIEYPAIHYLAEEKTLLVLAIEDGEERASIICVKDRGAPQEDLDDQVYDFASVSRSPYHGFGGEASRPTYLDAVSFDEGEEHWIYASVILADRWTVWEYWDAEDSCFDGEGWTVSLADASLMEANKHRRNLCWVTVTTMAGDYVGTEYVRDRHNFDETHANLGMSTLTRRVLTAKYLNWPAGAKAPFSHSYPTDKDENEVMQGWAVYWWTYRGSTPAQALWATSDLDWGVDIDPAPDGLVRVHPGLTTSYAFDGKICVAGAKCFDILQDYPDIGADDDKVTADYVEYSYWYLGGWRYHRGWENEPRKGRYTAGDNAQYKERITAVPVDAEVPFRISVDLSLDVSRPPDAQGRKGAGMDEYGRLDLANFQEKGPAMRLNLRLRCK